MYYAPLKSLRPNFFITLAENEDSNRKILILERQIIIIIIENARRTYFLMAKFLFKVQ